MFHGCRARTAPLQERTEQRRIAIVNLACLKFVARFHQLVARGQQRDPRPLIEVVHVPPHVEPLGDRRERGGDLRVAHVGLSSFTVHFELVNFGVKRIPHLTNVSREFDGSTSSSHLDLLESLMRQPVANRLNVSVCWTELRAKLLWSQPFVEIGGIFALLIQHQLLQCGLLLWAALQDKHHPFHGSCIAYKALVKLRAGEGVDVALEADELRFVDGLGDARGDGGLRDCGLSGRRASRVRLGLCGGAKGRERQKKSKGKEGIANCSR